MNDTTVLMMAYYREDARTLLRVAEELRRVAGVRPLFFIPSEKELREDAVRVVRAAGFDVLDEPRYEDGEAGRDVRSPFRRFRVVREANKRLAGGILERAGASAIVCTIDAARNFFIEAAGEAGIPSLYVQWTEINSIELHRAWWQAEARFSDRSHRPLMRLRRRLRRQIDAVSGFGHRWPFFIPVTRLAVAGPYYREMCLRAGIPAERIEVTGNVQGDAMHRCAHLTAEEIGSIKGSLGLPESARFQLYALNDTKRLVHMDQRSAAETERTILTAMRTANPELARVVKLHPKQGEEDRARIRAIDPDAVVVGEGTETGALVAASSIVVATASSVLLWAVGIDRPAVSTYLWKGADEMRSSREWPGVEKADSMEALVQSLSVNLRDAEHRAHWEARRRAGREAYLRVDGRSVERIVQSLRGLLREWRGAEALTEVGA